MFAKLYRKLGIFLNISSLHFSEKSSRQWMHRHLKDPYVKQSKELNLRSRAAFKLMEIDKTHKILKPGMKILEIGAAPGSWTQIICQKVESTKENPLVISVDLLSMNPIIGSIFIKGDITDEKIINEIKQKLGNSGVDLICSDAVPEFIGENSDDHENAVNLNFIIVDSCQNYLAKGGNLLMKSISGGMETKLKVQLKEEFKSVHYIKPQSSRSESKEIYILAKGYENGKFEPTPRIIKKKEDLKKEIKKEPWDQNISPFRKAILRNIDPRKLNQFNNTDF